MMTRTGLKLAAVAALASLAPACVSVLPEAKPPAPRYMLTPVDFEGDAPQVAFSLAVEDPSATRVYDTTKIAAMREPGRVEFFSGGEWADRGTRLIQSAIIRSYENSGRILAVGDRIALPAPDFVLNTDIRALHVDYASGAPVATFTLYARLIDKRGRVVAAKLFEAQEQAGANSVPRAARALDAAVGAVVTDLVAWTFDEGTKAL